MNTDMENGSESGTMPESQGGLVRRFGPIAAIICAAAFVYAMGWHEYLSLSKIAENRGFLRDFVSSNLALALLIYAGIYIAIVAFSLPGGAQLHCFWPPEPHLVKLYVPKRGQQFENLQTVSRKMHLAICCSCGWCQLFRFGWSI